MADLSPLRNYTSRFARGAVRSAAPALGAAVVSANQLSNTEQDYGADAMREDAPGVIGGNAGLAYGATAAPPRLLAGRRRITDPSRLLPGRQPITDSSRLPPRPSAASAPPSTGTSAVRSTPLSRTGAYVRSVAQGVADRARGISRAAPSPAQAARAAGAATGRAVTGIARRVPGAAAAYGVGAGLGDSFADARTGYAAEYERSRGVRSPTGAAAAAVGRTLENIGNRATGGYAGRIGQGLGSMFAGGNFSDGFSQAPARERFMEARRQRQANASGAARASTSAATSAPATPQINIIDPSDLPRRPGERNTFTGADGITRRVNATPDDRVPVAGVTTNTASGQPLAEATRGITRRAVGDINSNTGRTRDIVSGALLNPNGNDAEMLRRMINSMRSDGRGSPSMRRAIAEAYMGYMGAANDASLSGLRSGNEAISRGADNEVATNESFAERRDRANQFNAGLFEQRRQNDAANTLTAAEIMARRATGLGRGGANGPDATFEKDVYDDFLKITGDPARAAEMAARMATNAGLPLEESAYTRAGATRERDRIERGLRSYANRWFGFGTEGFDAASALPSNQTLGQRIWSRLRPGRHADDIKWTDAEGRVAWTPPSALEGETAAQAALRRRREMALRSQTE